LFDFVLLSVNLFFSFYFYSCSSPFTTFIPSYYIPHSLHICPLYICHLTVLLSHIHPPTAIVLGLMMGLWAAETG
jgi:hypothetical protein